MTQRLYKTVKIDVDTHRIIRIASAHEGVSMADWLARIVNEHAHILSATEYRLAEFNRLLAQKKQK